MPISSCSQLLFSIFSHSYSSGPAHYHPFILS
jgi:hypothetical protein